MKKDLILAAGLALAMAGSTTETRAEPAPCHHRSYASYQISQSVRSLDSLIKDKKSRDLFLDYSKGTRIERAIIERYKNDISEDDEEAEEMVKRIFDHKPELVRRYAGRRMLEQDCNKRLKKGMKQAYEKTSEGIKHILDKWQEKMEDW